MVYEQRAQEYLCRRYGRYYVPSPWFQYQEYSEARVRFCQPDGLLYANDLSSITIVEIKLKHTHMSWWQLKHKYGPILRHIFPGIPIRYVTLVKWFDVTIPYPEAVALRADLRYARSDEIQVTIWKP